MIYLHVRHTVANYSRWKSAFDDHAGTREAGGATGETYILRNTDNPNDVTLIMGWKSLAQAQMFTRNPELPLIMQSAGVIGTPEISFQEAAN